MLFSDAGATVQVGIHPSKCVITKLKLDKDQKYLLIWDVWSMHRSAAVRAKILAKHPNMCFLFVPPNMTELLQPLDLDCNAQFKVHVARKKNEWLTDELIKARDEWVKAGSQGVMRMPKTSIAASVLKPKMVLWLGSAFTTMNEAKVSLGQSEGMR